jgi:hypothetical protein
MLPFLIFIIIFFFSSCGKKTDLFLKDRTDSSRTTGFLKDDENGNR